MHPEFDYVQVSGVFALLQLLGWGTEFLHALRSVEKPTHAQKAAIGCVCTQSLTTCRSGRGWCVNPLRLIWTKVSWACTLHGKPSTPQQYNAGTYVTTGVAPMGRGLRAAGAGTVK